MSISHSKLIYVILGGLVVLLIYFIVSTSPKTIITPSKSVSIDEIDEKNELIKELSLLLNQASNQIGKLSCKLSDDVSEKGGWCSKISGKNSSQHATDLPLSKALSTFLKDKNVGSFGDGPGKKTL